MNAALILNGDAPSKADLQLLDEVDTIVCADGTAKHMLRAGRIPSVIVGDLDSLETDVYKWADAMSIPMERHPRDKDYTDGELAMRKALEGDPASLLILGGHGGRTSMFMANLKILRAAQEAGTNAVMRGNGETIRFRRAGGSVDLADSRGHIFNVLAIGGDADVSIHGASFSGDHLLLHGASARGISNRVDDEGSTRVEVHSGMALIIVEADRH